VPDPISISVVTTCYNSEEFIEDTIRSVVDQRYPNLQYIVKDGVSKDGTMDIIDRYKDQISTIISEKDNGQYHGLMQGFNHAEGDIFAWINADDVYYPWTFSVVSEVFQKFPEVDWIIGLPTFMNVKGQGIKVSSNPASAFPRNYIQNGWFNSQLGGFLQQESMFWRRSLWQKVGGLNLDLELAADFELWMRFAEHAALVEVVSPLACFRERPGEQRSSISSGIYDKEVLDYQRKSAPFIWRYIAKQGLAFRSLCRLLIWKKAKIIAFSGNTRKWEIREMYRPISRSTILDLLLKRSFK